MNLVSDSEKSAVVKSVARLDLGYAIKWANHFGKLNQAISDFPQAEPLGPDAWKLHQQIRQFGNSKVGMPPIFVHEDPDGILEISDGVTRATRIAKLVPGETVPVIVIGKYRRSRANSLRVKDRL